MDIIQPQEYQPFIYIVWEMLPEISTTYDWWSLLSTIKGTCPSAFSFSGPDDAVKT